MPYASSIHMTPPPPHENYYPSQSMSPTKNLLMEGHPSPFSHLAHHWSDLDAPTPFHLLVTLDIPDLYKLTNDPINHKLLWPPNSDKILVGIPKFERKENNDLATHFTTYHIWCFSNCMFNDSI